MQFGALTLLVGPQAVGKSLFLQLYKLSRDWPAITRVFKRESLGWSNWDEYLDIYFGFGSSQAWRKGETKGELDGQEVDLSGKILGRGRRSGNPERVFYVPAQRVLTLPFGRTTHFMAFDRTTPYVVRRFAESLRQSVDSGLGRVGPVFPPTARWPDALKKLVEERFFPGARVSLEEYAGERRFVLRPDPGGDPEGKAVHYYGWSSGQREFFPLLLAFYKLLPMRGERLRGVQEVVIEEPEMGLHPDATQAVAVLLFLLLARGYRVIVSTHTLALLEVVWALRQLAGRPHAERLLGGLLEVDALQDSSSLRSAFQAALRAARFGRMRVWFLERTEDGALARDISSLDVWSEDPGGSTWGRLTALSDRVVELVSSLEDSR